MEQHERRLAALTRLALATREKADRATYLLYLEHVQHFSTEVVVMACKRLESSLEWFPKVSQLVDECRIVTRYLSDKRDAERRRALDVPQVSSEKIRQFRADVAAYLERRRMR